MTASGTEHDTDPAAALLWQLDHGVDMPLSDDIYIYVPAAPKVDAPMADPAPAGAAVSVGPEAVAPALAAYKRMEAPPPTGHSELAAQAVQLAAGAQTLEALSAAIAGFEGVAMRRHATHMVFGAGHPAARVMVIGDAPGAEDDASGQPFQGEGGALLDKMLLAIGLDRRAQAPESAVYTAHVLNWRPPGGRSPTAPEIEMSLPFIERHIALVRPHILVFAGVTAAQSLLGVTDGITKLRGKWRDYMPRTLDPALGHACQAMTIFHPNYLLKTPGGKKDAWADLQEIQAVLARM